MILALPARPLANINRVSLVLVSPMAGDGEGATALFETKVTGAATKEDARTLAKSVICSSLTKAAIFGHDANWGRIGYHVEGILHIGPQGFLEHLL